MVHISYGQRHGDKLGRRYVGHEAAVACVYAPESSDTAHGATRG
ncbi:hypothetical protein HMPREF0742_00499 [Rothia aeria F0184]|uniref:Uncharacterized protein n=1 Tax=Rothia aeria F0184 TaxID=888019 RepID=U7V6C7_9MICC|nr:hypothetical protein HMPREF0742_00499 [Rothia aeria F0184]